MTTKVLVLGGRFGGLTAAYNLKREGGMDVEVKVVDRYSTTYFRPSIPHISIGVRRPEEIALDISDALPRKGISFMQGEVTSIDPGRSVVNIKTADGRGVEEPYDYLVVALGAHLAKEKVKGAAEHADALCEVDDMLRLKKRLASFKGGNITIGSGIFYQGSNPKPRLPENFVPRADSACEGPIFEFSLMAHGYLMRNKLLDKTKITVYAPGEYLSDLSKQSRDAVKSVYSQMGIQLVENFKLAEFTDKEVISTEGKRLPSDLSVYKPPYDGLPFLKKLSGDLSDDAGFIPTDMNMVSLKYPNIYAVGDINAGVIPKLGYLAVRTAEIAVRHLLGEIGLKTAVPSYSPMILCVADNPLEGYAVAVTDDTWFGGKNTQAVIAPVNHLKKELLTKYYMWSKGDMVLEKYFAAW
ncbi:MAG: FAD-dependent oxidoreductase [Methanomassiliicoccales archaeon]